MNTGLGSKRWVVITLILAVAALATVGFAPADPGNHGRAFLADVTVCEVEASLNPSLAVLDLLDDPCYAELVDLVEMEIDSGLISRPSAGESLLSRIYELSRSGGSQSVEYLSLIEVDPDDAVFSPSSSAPEFRAGEAEWFAGIREASMGAWELYTLDEFLSEVDGGVVSPS